MNNFKPHIRFNKKQRYGVLFLIGCIVFLQAVYFFVDFSSPNKNQFSSSELALFSKEIDSLELVKKEKLKPKIHPFNPNFITDFKGHQLGMSVEEIDRLLKFRQSNEFITSSKHFQEITKVSDSLLLVIAPYFKFPNWTSSKKEIKEPSSEKIAIVKKDLNLISKEELLKINGIGEKLADRILAYKQKLKGFSINEQLYEVYYLDKNVADKVLSKFEVIQPPTIEKLNINTATFKEVLSIVYVDYELTKLIFQYKTKVGKITSINELKKIDNFPLEKFNRIALYLQAN